MQHALGASQKSWLDDRGLFLHHHLENRAPGLRIDMPDRTAMAAAGGDVPRVRAASAGMIEVGERRVNFGKHPADGSAQRR